jgi:transposase-like protein
MTKHSGQQIVAKLREADVELGKGLTVPQMCKKIGVSGQTYYRWRQKYGADERTLVERIKAMASNLGN